MLCLGLRHSPTPDHIRLLAAMLPVQRMVPKASVDYHKAYAPDGDALGNDQAGNCVPVAEYQSAGIRMANAWGSTWRPVKAQTIKLYSSLTGFNPATGQPDEGTDTVQAMTSWVQNGLDTGLQGPESIIWTTVDPTNIDHIKLAIDLTGPLQFSLNLPNSAQDLSKPWDVPNTGIQIGPGVPGSWGGHRVTGAKYDRDYVYVRTWGVDHPMTWRFFLTYGLAVDATLARSWFDTDGQSPGGLTWAQVRAAFKANGA